MKESLTEFNQETEILDLNYVDHNYFSEPIHEYIKSNFSEQYLRLTHDDLLPNFISKFADLAFSKSQELYHDQKVSLMLLSEQTLNFIYEKIAEELY